MKKTQFIDLISVIRKTLVSFTAIVVFITLGLAFNGGMIWVADHAEKSFVQTYQDGRMQTLLVTDPLGLTEDQISELKSIDGIDDAEGCNIVYRFFENNDGTRQQSAVIQITENIDRLINVEGQLPTSAGQAAVLRSWAEENGVSIGDVIVLENKDGADYREFQSVRTVSEWDGEDLNELNVSTEDPGYLACNELTITAVVDSPVYLSTNPYAHGICSANGLYIDAVLFVSKEEMPPEAFGGYTSAVLISNELNSSNPFSSLYKSRSQDLSEEIQEIVDGWDRQMIENFKESVDTLRQRLDVIYSQTGAMSPDGESLYVILSRMQEELSEKESFAGVTETDANNSFLTADSLISVLDSMRSVLGITFLAIGVLICYSVVSRLVADAAVQIGTRKALGFYRREILRLYLCYVGAAVLTGGILSIAVGVFGIEYALAKVFAVQFTFTEIPLVCNLTDILPAFLIISGIILATASAACVGLTNKSAIALLQNENGEKGSFESVQRLRVFNRLSLLNRTVVLNLCRDRRRVFGMITGIAGATALMTAGLSFYFNFTDAFSKQFEDYYNFDYQVCFDASSDTASENIRRVLDSYGLNYAEIYSSCLIMHTPDGGSNAPNVIVPADTEELAGIMCFSTDEAEATAYDGGVWMSEYYCYAFDAPEGSLLNLQTLGGRKAEIPVDCYYKYHLATPVVVMDSDAYRDAFGENASPNAFYVASGGLEMNKLSEELENIDGYIYTYDFYESFLASFASEKMFVSAMAALFIIMAILMAMMTIINLLNVYIMEKKNELIILMINGYDSKFAKRYIYQDTVLLTIIGILIGLVAGSIMGDRTLTAVEGTSMRMIHGISIISCAVSAAATAGLTVLICRRALRRVDKFKLSDISRG